VSALDGIQLLLVAAVFVWSGFVRSGLGFGGAVLSLPFLLLVHDDPLLFLPPIATQLLFFSSLMGVQQWLRGRRGDGADAGGVDWPYLRRALCVMIVPKLIGVLGLLTLPAGVMATIVFAITGVYALSYILDRPFRARNRALDPLFLALGGYMSGTSLVGAPLILAVFASHVAAAKLRDTLFALWFVLVSIKMAAFVWAGVDLQLRHQLWLFPCAALGHVLGLRFHDHLMRVDPRRFYRVLGCVLLGASAAGLFA
jgi:hypothetical protein